MTYLDTLQGDNVHDTDYWRGLNTPNIHTPFTIQPAQSDWHDEYSIQLGELIEGGFNPFGDEHWSDIDWVDDTQRTRFEQKFEYRYRYWEIGITPPLVWRTMLTSRMMELMPKYKPFYQAIANGTSLLQEWDEYSKHRHVYSDFPQTELAGDTQDYAANSTDTQYETVHLGDYLDKIGQAKDYKDLDAMLLDDVKEMFSCLMTVQTPW